MKKLAIAVPTYNEKENIVQLVEEVYEVLKTVPFDTTIIIMDDNSPDGTGEIADDLSRKFTKSPFKVEVIHRKEKLGLGTAYIAAFKKALHEGNDYILSMDADLSHKPKYVPTFLEKIQKYDLVIGSRNVRGGGVENWSVFRNILSKGASLYARTILGVSIRDLTGGYNMFRREVLESINLDEVKSEGFAFWPEMKYRTVKSGFSVFEYPIIFPDRVLGKSKMSLGIMLEGAFRMWQIRFLKL